MKAVTESLRSAQNNLSIGRQGLETTLYFLLLLFLPTQLGKHFWPLDAFVLGQRIDYLSPTIYTTDILLVLLLLIYLRNLSNPGNLLKESKKILGIFLLLSINIFFSENRFESVYETLKLAEMAFLILYTGIVWKKAFQIASLAFTFGIIFESILATIQFFHQGSLNGVFYYFGERMFSSATPGIANASINGELVLRPYGTFSHPNVLAAYLVIGMTILITRFTIYDSRFKKVSIGVSFVLGTSALFLTLSRVAIIVWLLVCCFLFVKIYWKNIQNIRLRLSISAGQAKYLIINGILSLFIIVFVIFSPIFPRFTQLTLRDESIVLREQLAADAFQMIFAHPFTGVGLHSFLTALPSYDFRREGSSLQPFPTLQPVHNIFLLIGAETGFIGLWLAVAFIIWLYIRLYKNYRHCEGRSNPVINIPTGLHETASLKNGLARSDGKSLSLLLLTEVIFLGSFDHYFLTLQQGQLLLSLVLGICLSIRESRSTRHELRKEKAIIIHNS